MWIATTVLLLVVAYGVLTFNRLVRASNRVEEAWSDIDVQLQRRYDLVPNLVLAVEQYTDYEGSALLDIARARTESMNTAAPIEKGKTESVLSEQFKSLIAVAESYPDLKASDSFLKLQKALVDTEDQIQYARRYYNGSVRDFNILTQTFPNNLMAGRLGFESEPFFEIQLATERAAPEVDLKKTSNQ